MSNAIAALGTLLKLGDQAGTSGTTYTAIAEIKTLGGPSLAADTADVTSHDSATAASGFEEAIVTILRTGEVTFGISYVPTEGTHDATSGILSVYKGGTKRNYELEFPDTTGTTWSFDAFVTGFEPNMDADTELDASVTLKPTGKPTLA